MSFPINRKWKTDVFGSAMSPQEVQERLKLDQLKDKIWYVVPSCATTGDGLFEGLVSNKPSVNPIRLRLTLIERAGFQTTSRLRASDCRNDNFSSLSNSSSLYGIFMF